MEGRIGINDQKQRDPNEGLDEIDLNLASEMFSELRDYFTRDEEEVLAKEVVYEVTDVGNLQEGALLADSQ